MKINIKSILKGIAEEVALKLVREFLNNNLEKITPNDLKNAIENDINVLDVATDEIKEESLKWISRFREYESLITVETVMEWLEHDRPDLWVVIFNYPDKKGLQWLKKQIDDIKEKLFGITVVTGVVDKT